MVLPPVLRQALQRHAVVDEQLVEIGDRAGLQRPCQEQRHPLPGYPAPIAPAADRLGMRRVIAGGPDPCAEAFAGAQGEDQFPVVPDRNDLLLGAGSQVTVWHRYQTRLRMITGDSAQRRDLAVFWTPCRTTGSGLQTGQMTEAGFMHGRAASDWRESATSAALAAVIAIVI